MAGQKKSKRDNSIVRYFRETRAELRKVRWPTWEEGWVMTRIVLVVTFGMALFLGALDAFFRWLLQGVIAQNLLYIILSIIVLIALISAAVLIGQSEEV